MYSDGRASGRIKFVSVTGMKGTRSLASFYQDGGFDGYSMLGHVSAVVSTKMVA